MKRLIIILALFTICISADAQTCDRQQLRSCYRQCFQRRTALDSFITMLEKSGKLTAAQESYLGISYGLSIQYIEGIWGKYRMLMKSKGLLNSAVEKEPDDPELRFMRFTLEHNIPSYLCMSTHMNDDLRTILSHPTFLDESPDLKSAAIQFMLDSKRCNPEQTKLLEKVHADIKKRMTAEK